jgi:hypothetical protein
VGERCSFCGGLILLIFSLEGEIISEELTPTTRTFLMGRNRSPRLSNLQARKKLVEITDTVLASARSAISSVWYFADVSNVTSEILDKKDLRTQVMDYCRPL